MYATLPAARQMLHLMLCSNVFTLQVKEKELACV